MNKEKLEKEAEEKAGIYFDSLDYDHGNVSDTPFSSYDIYTAYKKGALDFAEPREKQITGLSKHILELQKDKGNLTDRVRELEQQIEKMKCCGNCAKRGHICVAEEMQGILCGKNKDKWELRR